MLNRPQPRRFETDISGLSYGTAEPNTQKEAEQKEAESQPIDQGKSGKQDDQSLYESNNQNQGEKNMSKKVKIIRQNPDASMFSQHGVIHIGDEHDGDDDANDDNDKLYVEAYDQAMLSQKGNTHQKQDRKRNLDGSNKPTPSSKSENTTTAGGRKYIGLSEFERGIPRDDAYGRATTLARGNPARYEMAFVKQDVLSGPPFPIQPPNAVVFWMCRTCREISQRTKGKSFANGRTTFTIDICKPCRIVNCEVRDCFQDQDFQYGTMTPEDVDVAHRKYPYQGQFTPLGGAPFSLQRVEALALLMCEYCRLLTSIRECQRDVTGRCRLTIDMCQKCVDANSEMSMALYPTQAELDRQKDRRSYFAGMFSAPGTNKVVQTHGKCIRD